MKNQIILFVLFPCLFVTITSILATLILIHRSNKKNNSFGGISALAIPSIVMGLLLILYSIFKDYLLLNLNLDLCGAIITIAWMVLIFCIFIYSFITKEDSFLPLAFLVIIWGGIIPSTISANSLYRLFFDSCFFLGIFLTIIILFRCKSSK